MGASSRATHVIEPGNGDLLMPDRTRKERALRPRDVEDACFETIGAPGDRFSRKPSAAEIGGVFKSRLTGPPEQGPFPPDFACSDRTSRPASSSNGRLGVFSGKPSAHAGPGSRLALAASAFVLTVGGFAAAALWTTSTPERVLPTEAHVQAPISAPAVAGALSRSVEAPLIPDPVTTSSTPAKETETGTGYTTPAPRPARIERAGSILMIRPGGS
ncbi:MAG: hypothetical protein KUA43_22660 [Hoeflea sp.]|nr:hypothetical protein [Hoeflea sp.]MBU4528648.1 hypothetical protein [Alphaproteobacteria bacterium]MBU4545547.1 hypothetical protein [Alphaproteobacteria bacterium]MBU4552157.1 hypothetical protein [Alphaproteobacteria bacterium]MBV1726251.1 hypothetical protein [Hoeflea sp.]MBV1784926.1 hypothetical protein [Hoeflea sp.]